MEASFVSLKVLSWGTSRFGADCVGGPLLHLCCSSADIPSIFKYLFRRNPYFSIIPALLFLLTLLCYRYSFASTISNGKL